MIHVLQCFRRVVTLDKATHRAHDREASLAWPPAMLSPTGEVRDGELVVPAVMLSDPERAVNGGVILLSDIVPGGPHPRPGARADAPSVTALPRGANVAYDVFRLLPTVAGFDVWLDYAHHAMTIGEPSRADMKIAELAPGRPVWISINGKADFSMTGRRERTYIHREYLLTHLGSVESVRVSGSALGVMKAIDRSAAKHVDLRAMLA